MSGQLTSLSRLLAADRDSNHAVAFGAAGVSTWAEFSGAVVSLSERLVAAPASRWLVCFEDSYAFAVALLAVAHSGGVAVLPPNGQSGTLERLSGEVEGFLVGEDAPLARASGEVIRDPLVSNGQECAEPGRLDREAVFAEFFTSGTSGDNKRIRKRLRHLDDELAVLESVFGESMGDARIVSTVSHQHIYGALFRVLWPLAAGRSFSAQTYLHGSEVVGRVAEARSALVSSPIQLKAMADSDTLAGVSPVAVFSSGAPLDERTAVRVAAATGTAVSELFGSTETGGVAWRRRPLGGEVPWRPLPGVDIERDPEGRLSVTSRLVSVGEEAGEDRRRFSMGDRVDVDSDGNFTLRGRADRVVKVGSKRLSLPDMEAELARHELVEECVLVVSRRGLDSRVCAAVVLSEAGRKDLEGRGRGELGKSLNAVLSPYFDRVLLPRGWRFVDSLPRTPQGKLSERAVRSLFDAEAIAPLDPVVESERVDGLRIHRSCVVPEDLAFFDGHFESFPIVPGVAQLRWVATASQTLLGRAPKIVAVEALKFRQPLLPGSRFELEVVGDEDRKRLRFRLWRDDGEVSTGRLVLG